ncbi:MAG: DUF1801 domain-containing protein [Bernardetiaceae bacterium]|jgi:hypothetical protein|nr:DUF1801 domain-containing protein [Bernardetiaceae bacterium]
MREDDFYLGQPEPVRACLLALRHLILTVAEGVTPVWQYGMPFFCHDGRRFCYLWVDRKTHQPYLGIVDGQRVHHPLLVSENRARMKVIRFDPAQDLPRELILEILRAALGG